MGFVLVTKEGRLQSRLSASGVARISPMLGHTMFVRNSAQSAEAFRGSGACVFSVR